MGRVHARSRVLLALAASILAGSCGPDGTGIQRNPLDPNAVSPGLVISPQAPMLGWIGASTQLTATLSSGVAPAGVRLQWHSLDESVVRVGDSGVATAIAEGSAKVVVALMNLADTATVTVKRVPTKVLVSVDSLRFVDVGQSATVNASALDGGGQPLVGVALTWTTSDSTVATVSGGVVTARGHGLARIVATVGAFADTVSVRVILGPASVTTEPTSLTFSALGDSARIVATVRNAAGFPIQGIPVTFSTTNAAVARVSASGWVTSTGAGVANITARGDTVSATVPVTVAQTPAVLVLAPKSGTVAIGAVLQLSASGTDRNGYAIAGLTPTWTTLDASVAEVSQTGVVSGKALGTARILAVAGTAKDTATVTVVSEPVARITISPTSLTIPRDQSDSLAARTFGAGGTELFGRTVTWVSANAAIATVTGTGRVAGVSVGSTWVRATADLAKDSARVTVTQPTPEITAITPAVLVPGAVGEISGRYFGSSASTVAVFVDNAAATVTSVTETKVTFRVPSYAGLCLPRTQRSLRVRANSVYSASLNTTVETTGKPVQMDAGGYVVFVGPDADCVALAEVQAGEDYLVAVQSYATSPVTQGYIWRSVQGSSNINASSADSKLALEDNSHRAGRLDSRREEDQWAVVDSLTRALRASGIRVVQDRRAQLRSPSRSPVVGETRTFFTSAATQITARAVRVGPSIAIYLDDARPYEPTPAFLDNLLNTWETVVAPAISQGIGVIPDHDGNSVVSMVLTTEVTKGNCYRLGYVRPDDWYPPSYYPPSNHADVFFSRTPDPNGVDGCPYTEASVLAEVPPTMAHEVVHIIDVDEKLTRSGGQAVEELWLSEAKAQIGIESVIDYLTQAGRSAETLRYRLLLLDGVVGLEGERTESLPVVYQYPTPVKYGLAWLFISWLRSAYGSDAFKATIYSDALGTKAVEQALGVPFGQALAQFAVAMHDGGDKRMGAKLVLPQPVRRDLAGYGLTYFMDKENVMFTRAYGTVTYPYAVRESSAYYERFLASATTGGLAVSVRSSQGMKLTTQPLQVVIWRRPAS